MENNGPPECCDQNTGKRSASIPQAMAIMDEELDDYLVECRRRAAAPAIEALVRYTDGIKNQNLDWAKDKLEHLSEKDLKVVADLASRMAKGFLEAPIHELKETFTAPHHREIVLKLFQLDSGGCQHR